MNTNSYFMLLERILKSAKVHLAKTETGRHLITDALWTMVTTENL